MQLQHHNDKEHNNDNNFNNSNNDKINLTTLKTNCLVSDLKYGNTPREGLQYI